MGSAGVKLDGLAVRTPTTTPAGASLSVRPWGRHFSVVDIDRWRISDWPQEARAELHRLAENLATLAVYRRQQSVFVSNFISSGYLYVPSLAVQQVLAAVLSAEGGDTTRVTPLADLAEQAAAMVTSHDRKSERRAVAAAAVSWFVQAVAEQQAAAQ